MGIKIKTESDSCSTPAGVCKGDNSATILANTRTPPYWITTTGSPYGGFDAATAILVPAGWGSGRGRIITLANSPYSGLAPGQSVFIPIYESKHFVQTKWGPAQLPNVHLVMVDEKKSPFPDPTPDTKKCELPLCP